MNVQTLSAEPEHIRAFVEAARTRLENASTCEDAREGVREIVANLIGSEQMALFEIDYSKAIMWQRWSHGIDCGPSKPVDLIPYPELYRALQGEILTYPQPVRIGCFLEPVSAIAPIPPADVPSGLLVLFGILPQKESLTQTDRELLAVISGAALRAVGHGNRPEEAS
jgi:hypothetical protein